MVPENLSRLIQQIAKDCDVNYNYLWEEKGPHDTAIEWHGSVLIGGCVFYYQVYKPSGWEVFCPVHDGNDIEATAQAMRDRISHIERIIRS